MMLPPAIAPFHVVVTPANNADPKQKEAAERIYGECLALGLDALLDDRDERPGVKFKDADLIGVPFRITVGKKLASGMVELVERRTKASVDVPVADAKTSFGVDVKFRHNVLYYHILPLCKELSFRSLFRSFMRQTR